MVANLQKICNTLKAPMRWKDLRDMDKCIVKITNLPFNWKEGHIRHCLFEVLEFPQRGLVQIKRVVRNGRDTSEVLLLYLKIPEILLAWNRAGAMSFRATKSKMISWSYLPIPYEYQDFQECLRCLS
jgi:hypothetical protein